MTEKGQETAPSCPNEPRWSGFRARRNVQSHVLRPRTLYSGIGRSSGVTDRCMLHLLMGPRDGIRQGETGSFPRGGLLETTHSPCQPRTAGRTRGRDAKETAIQSIRNPPANAAKLI